MLVKITDRNQSVSKSISVCESEPFTNFKEKCEKKLAFKIKSFYCRDYDDSEIDDDDTLAEILKMPPKHPSTVHLFVALKLNEEILKRDDIQTLSTCSNSGSIQTLDSMKKELTDLRADLGDKSEDIDKRFSKLKHEEEKLKKKIEDKSKDMENGESMQSYERKIKKLQDEYNELLYKSIKTEQARTVELSRLEIKKVNLEIRKTKIAKLFFELRMAEQVDICFMVDCTGSMCSYINEAKTVVHRVVEKLGKKFQDLKLRCAFVGYRDHCDHELRVEVMPFTSDKDAFKNKVTLVNALGGGDEAEDIFGGLEEVNKLGWKNMTRVLFHIGDAPCHGREFHNGSNDTYLDGDPRGLKIDKLLANLAGKNIDYYFAEINSSTAKMIDEFNKILLKNQGNMIKVVKLSNSHELLESVSWSISSSIMNSKSLSMHEGKGKPLKNYQVDGSPINWGNSSLFDVFYVDLYETSFEVGDLTKIKDTEVKYSIRKVEIHLAKKPFAKGALRYAFAAIINTGTKHKPNLVRSVMKEPVFIDHKYNSEDYLKALIEVQVISKFLAEKFMEAIGCEKSSMKFLSVNLIRAHESGLFYSSEDFVPGSFTKWTNNAGIVNEEDYATALNAFSHWTYQATNKYLIVTDLQGFKNDDVYVLTDPAITCTEDWERFSSTNLAIKGVEKFFKSHQCNQICRDLHLEKHKMQILPDI